MKRFAILITTCLSLSACENTWDSETKEMFHQSCLEEALPWTGDPNKAKTYCDCVLEKTMQKYPDYKDALMHIDSVTTNPELQKCRAMVEKTP